MTPNAKPPNGCMSHEAVNCPEMKSLIDLPNPQPGHQLMPRLDNGHRLVCPASVGSIQTIPIKAKAQKYNSNGIFMFLFYKNIYEKGAISKIGVFSS